ncbi:muscleblind-like protein 2 isoform X28 [Drosophila sulfurigaster albostrigata]|uniref:muscleblind-like protein 2 isoform X28 n=1 Tax=Drosophila sulfurigaster albostrigata TaxID=89887 RepID=UPI002D21859A|nr:muscleblind-like protein 2 isoform X28 [Drosophila sulfurigaster albostrigata]
MANVVNMNSLLNGKDSRWLQLEVCREFQRNKCSRQDTECKFAHPPANVEVQNGKVTACYDSIKGRCNRDKPPCKYFHPPQHLKDQLLINGRNHLALKNALMQQMGIAPGQPVISGQVPAVATSPYLTGIPANTYSPYYATGHLVPTLLGPDPTAVASQLGPVVPQTVQVAQQKIPRSDRLEQFSGMVPFKRPAAEKSGIPVYQPGATTYQQLMPPYVPVSSNTKIPPLNASCVIYTDASGQLLDTLPVCQDFNRSMCSRLNCRFVHLTEDDKVEVLDQRVAVCRDHANSQCRRKQCKYYHIPIVLPPANIMAAMITNPSEQQATAANGTVVTTTTTPGAVAAGYNHNNSNTNNLIIIETHQQQQQQPQQQFGYHTSNNSNNYYNNNTAAHGNNVYQQHHQQQQQHITYHRSSPYSPSSTSSSSSCSIATSPTLSSATTLSTTSTATMPTPQQQYAAAAAPAATFLKAPAYYADSAPTLVLSNDYNSNCIPIQAAPYISLPQQHVLKYTAQPRATNQQQQQHHSLIHHQFMGHHFPVVATTVAALPATTITVTPASIATPSPCI